MNYPALFLITVGKQNNSIEKLGIIKTSEIKKRNMYHMFHSEKLQLQKAIQLQQMWN